VIEIKIDEFPANLKLKATFSSLRLPCPTYKRELRHISDDPNYKIFSKEITWNLVPNMSVCRTSA